MKCRLCSSSVRPYASGLYSLDEVSFDLVKCAGCGVVFVDPFPDPGRIAGLYDDEYFQRDYSFGIVEGDYLASEVAREGEYRRILSRIARLTHGRKMLEVGCAAGAFLNEARSQGWETTGVDISPWAVKTAREKFDLDVREGTLEGQGFPTDNFDAIFFGDILEHLPDPISFLREVKRVAKPYDQGGVVVGKVPTYVNSFYYRWLKMAAKLSLLSKNNGIMTELLKLSDTPRLLPPYHLYEYHPAGVRRLLNEAGLEIFAEERLLMIPEFLYNRRDIQARLLLMLFGMLRFFIESFRLHGGHVLVFAASSEKGVS